MKLLTSLLPVIIPSDAAKLYYRLSIISQLESGPAVLGKQGIRDVGATFDTRDLDVGVRNAALDFCYTLYTCVGRCVLKLSSSLSLTCGMAQ